MQWGKEKGLFTECFASTKQLNTYTAQFVRELSLRNPEALNQLKQIFWHGTEDWYLLLEQRAEMSGRLILSSESQKAIQRFLDKK